MIHGFFELNNYKHDDIIELYARIDGYNIKFNLFNIDIENIMSNT